MVSFDDCVNEFLMVKRSERRAVKTIKAYNNDLERFKRYLISQKINIEDIDTINKYILMSFINFLSYDKKKWDDHKFNSTASEQIGLSKSSVNNITRNLKVFFNYLCNEKIIKKNPLDNISYQKEDRNKFEVFSNIQTEKLLNTPNQHTFMGFRDYVMMLIMLDNGIRINELCNIKINDIDFDMRTMKIRDVVAKTCKQRFVPISIKAVKYIKELIGHCRLNETDYLILNQFGEQLNSDSFSKNLRRYGRLCNINNVRVSPHTLRHTFATNYLLNGGDVFSLQNILGHSSIDMVKRYVHYNENYINQIQNKCTPLNNIHCADDNNKRSKKTVKFNSL